MTEMGFPKTVGRLKRKSFMKYQQSSVRTLAGDAEWFSIERGVRQGCILSPYTCSTYTPSELLEM